MVAALENPRTGWAARAERSLLRELEGGCAVPIGAWTTVTKGGVDAGMLSLQASICCLTDDLGAGGASSSRDEWTVTMQAVLTSPDGKQHVAVEESALVRRFHSTLSLIY